MGSDYSRINGVGCEWYFSCYPYSLLNSQVLAWQKLAMRATGYVEMGGIFRLLFLSAAVLDYDVKRSSRRF